MDYVKNKKNSLRTSTVVIVVVTLILSSASTSVVHMFQSQFNTVFAKSYEGSSLRDERMGAMAPSTIGQNGEGDFNTQFVPGSLKVAPTTNIVNIKATYDIVFKTNGGLIHEVHMQFPLGTNVDPVTKQVIEGLPEGQLRFGGPSEIIYTVASPQNIAAGTNIRIVLGNLVNPTTAGTVSPDLSVQVSTETQQNVLIDPPTNTQTYVVRKIDTAELGDNAVTGDKIAPGSVTNPKLGDGAVTSDKIADGAVTRLKVASASATGGFMSSKHLFDNAAGNTAGWNPDGTKKDFTISDPRIDDITVVTPNLIDPSLGAKSHICSVSDVIPGGFVMTCNVAPDNGSELIYTLARPPTF